MTRYNAEGTIIERKSSILHILQRKWRLCSLKERLQGLLHKKISIQGQQWPPAVGKMLVKKGKQEV